MADQCMFPMPAILLGFMVVNEDARALEQPRKKERHSTTTTLS